MSLLLETTVGNVTIDLDTDGSPQLVRNVLKLAKCRYYTNTLIYNVQPHRLCQLGDPRGDGTGGCSIFGLIDAAQSKLSDVRQSRRRFVKSDGRPLTAAELCERGRLVASEIGGVRDTVGSQLILTVDGGRSGEGLALDGLVGLGSGGDATTSNAADTTDNGQQGRYLSVGMVVEDEDDVLGKINGLYCDANGRPYADVRIIRAHVLDDPFDDPDGLEDALAARGVKLEPPTDTRSNGNEAAPRLATASPAWERPPEEIVERRIGADVALAEDDANVNAEEQEEALRKKEDKSRAVVLEMLGDLPSADIAAPDNVLFVCKLNPVTDDEDLELIFSRFDPNARAEIIRDPDTGDSLCYAFVEFTTKEQCNEAYFKMNNALVDDRRIKVDFSQSVAKVWNKYTQRKRGGAGGAGHHNGGERGRGMGRGGRGGAGGGFGPGGRDIRGSSDGPPQRRWEPPHSRSNGHGRYHQSTSQKATGTSEHNHHHHRSDDARHYRKVEDRSHNDDRVETRRHGGQGDDRRRSRSRSREKSDKQSRGRRSPPHRRHRSRSRSPSRDRKRRHHRKDHKTRDRHGSRDDDHGDDRRRERKHESKKKRRHKSRSRSEDRDRKKASRKHVSSSRNRSRS